MVADAASYGSARQAGALLDEYLGLLGTPFHGARLEIGPPCWGGTAWCEPGVVHIRPALGIEPHRFWGAGGLGRLMLAHEAVHFAQFTARASLASRERLELEADELAGRLVAGERGRVSLAAAPARLHWGRAGHYWTVFLAGLVAGADEFTARRMAFYCQLPDLISEFDATAQTATRLNLLDMWGQAPVGAFAGENRGVRPTDPEVCLDVIEGLHCLTGASVALERPRRRAILMNAAWGSLEFGVGLHAFGDSYAHANPSDSSMYPNRFGHGPAGHLPDQIHVHQATYWTYYDALLEVLRSKVARRSTPSPQGAPSADAVRQELHRITREVPDSDDETQQIPLIQAMIRRLAGSQGAANYEPANECVPWAEFLRTRVGSVILRPEDFNTIMGYARAWRHTPRDPRPAAAREQEIANRIRRDAERQAQIRADAARSIGDPRYPTD